MIHTPESELARLKEKAAAFDAIERLRKNEGACVEIVCDDPEAEVAHETMFVEITDDWTRWQPHKFYGPTLAAALAIAEHERTLYSGGEMKLKPCPFCGGKAARDETPEGGHYIQCSKCHASSAMMFPDKCDVRELLAERWNYRVPSDGNGAAPVERMAETDSSN